MRRRPDRTDVAILNDCPCRGRLAETPGLRPFVCLVCHRTHYDGPLATQRAAAERLRAARQRRAKFKPKAAKRAPR